MSASASPAGFTEPVRPTTTSFPFVVHSPSTIPLHMVSSPDERASARQKRKRTSPADQMFLEAEFQRDPRPDKTARFRIQQHVSLNEKEVQIWFQNRRQNTRRRQRPLSPYELSTHLDAQATAHTDPRGTRLDLSAPVLHRSRSLPSTSFPSAHSPNESKGINVERVYGVVDETYTLEYALHNNASQSSQDSSTTTSSSTAPPHHNTTTTTTSHVRLSTTTDGAARIITTASSSPTPSPHKPSLRRTHSSSTTTTTLDHQQQQPRRGPPKGHSRDSRAWEFWCDSAARTELLRRADQASSGSAADAITLMRSHARAPLLTLTAAKANTRAVRRRSRGGAGAMVKKVKVKVPRVHVHVHGHAGSGDSDKENREPGIGGLANADPFLKKRTLVLLSPETSEEEEVEEVEGEVEVEEGEAVSSPLDERGIAGKAEDEEMDCVQGLLSLSQGNWA